MCVSSGNRDLGGKDSQQVGLNTSQKVRSRLVVGSGQDLFEIKFGAS